MSLNKNAKNLIRFWPDIVNEFADRLVEEIDLMSLVKTRTIRTPEDLRPPIETREE